MNPSHNQKFVKKHYFALSLARHAQCLLCVAFIALTSPALTALLLEPFLEPQMYVYELGFSYLSIRIFKFTKIVFLL